MRVSRIILILGVVVSSFSALANGASPVLQCEVRWACTEKGIPVPNETTHFRSVFLITDLQSQPALEQTYTFEYGINVPKPLWSDACKPYESQMQQFFKIDEDKYSCDQISPAF